jgi:hypothetical protein
MRIVTRNVLFIGVIAGIALAVLSDAGIGSGPTIRVVVLPIALAAVIGGLIETVMLGRAEWQRVRPARRDYVRTVAFFLVGFVLAAFALG